MKFSTNLNCGNCVAAVAPALDGDTRVVRWAVDTNDPKKILTVEGEQLSEAWVRSTIADAGFHVIARIDLVPLDSSLPVMAGAGSLPLKEQVATATAASFSLARYKPLLLIVGYLLAAVAIVEWQQDGFDGERAMSHFMGGFFLVFSFFKLLDLSGFASAFAMYDIVARRIWLYAWLYPFIEILLGVAYLARKTPAVVHWATLAIMLVGCIGVVSVLRRGATIRCACLGTVFNLPMSVVTVVENGLMALMAAAMLVRAHG